MTTFTEGNDKILFTPLPPYFLSGRWQQVCFIIIPLSLQGGRGGGGGGGGGRLRELYDGGEAAPPLLGLESSVRGSGQAGHSDHFPVFLIWGRRNQGESGLVVWLVQSVSIPFLPGSHHTSREGGREGGTFSFCSRYNSPPPNSLPLETSLPPHQLWYLN